MSTRVLLVDELQKASFAYYGSPFADDPEQWHSQWVDDAESFPKLVQARLVGSTDQQPWPELNLVLQTPLVK